MNKRILIVVLLLIHFVGFSQRKNRYKYEWVGGIGFTNFLGDLGGANGVGTHYIKDYEILSTRPVISAGMRYKNNTRFAFKGMLSIGMLSGADHLTQEEFRNNRNLSFRSPIIELSAQAEFYLTRDKPGLYKISGIRNKKKKKYSLYAFTGLGTFFYCPQGKNESDKWMNLRKLHTEGQGLPGGPKQYSNFNICIPVGMGYKFALDRKTSVGFEVGFRKTFTDYIDDVSTNYYDNSAILAAYGTNAAYLADPSKGSIFGQTATDMQRGNPKYKDAYMFFTVTAGYKFQKRRTRTRSKF